MKRYNREYPAPSSQPAGVKIEPMTASSEGFATPTELKQKTIDIPGKSVKTKGTYMMKILNSELNYFENFREVRGRGMRFSVEHKAKNNDKFT